MRLYLVQHGEALAKDQDPERLLSAQGKNDISRLATSLKKQQPELNLIMHSGKTRAKQTAELMAGLLSPQGTIEVRSDLNPMDPIGPILSKICSLSSDSLIVGHLPFIGKLVAQLVNGKEDKAVVCYSPGTLACLETDDHIDWCIISVLNPQWS